VPPEAARGTATRCTSKTMRVRRNAHHGRLRVDHSRRRDHAGHSDDDPAGIPLRTEQELAGLTAIVNAGEVGGHERQRWTFYLGPRFFRWRIPPGCPGPAPEPGQIRELVRPRHLLSAAP